VTLCRLCKPTENDVAIRDNEFSHIYINLKKREELSLVSADLKTDLAQARVEREDGGRSSKIARNSIRPVANLQLTKFCHCY